MGKLSFCRHLFPFSISAIEKCKTWFPLPFQHAVQLNQAFCQYFPDFDWIIPGCPFMSLSINIGPHAVCEKHLDLANLVAGICLIFVFGHFDYKTSGHLILHHANVIWEGPSGTVFFILSAVFPHQNIALLAGEDRCVMTLYTQAGLFRFRDQGFQTAAHCPTLPHDLAGIDRFLTADQLQAHWREQLAQARAQHH
ncbi:hypothetical protein SISNIDRAFT_420804 [Sistotremastrum niveocremeum HHB9708]|uniref:Uncharacterized protein n=1 Tax=Sistotremastrum niveocremeum HHB9708 TaxID=1314777 RepID=A0A164M9I6_9AGAM|nr:hypothetical protein SISNIDRAFT_420804 [Sistotremastrum niveocremeum HHB9708]